MARAKEEPAEIRRKRIIEAAKGVLLKNGYQELKMAEVAKRARLAAGTLYLYFKDKDDLYVGIFQDVLNEFDLRLSRIPLTLPAAAGLHQFVEEMLALVDENQDFLYQSIREQPNLSKTKAESNLAKRYGTHLKLIASWLKKGISEGILRPHDARLGSLYFSMLVRTFMIDKVMRGTKTPLKNRAPQFMDYLLHGLGSPKISRKNQEKIHA